MDQINKFAEKIDSLSLRERAVVFVGIVAVLFTIWDSALIAPLEKEHKNLVATLNTKNVERQILISRFQALHKMNKSDPNSENIAILKNLRSRLIDVQADLESSTDNLVSPKDMPKLLETVLHKIGGLTLVNLKSLGASPIVAKTETETSPMPNNHADDKELTAENIDNAYKHGLRIEISGDYLTTLSYLKSLEELDWGFFWEKFNLSVSEYPDADVAIEIFTLSLEPAWIGV